MKVITELTTPLTKPVVLTIGNFDGIHRGHQAVLSRVSSLAHEHGFLSAVVTFENHPTEVLKPENAVLRICSLPHKIRLLEKAGIDCVYLLRFTKELSQLSPNKFLHQLQDVIPFHYLILGDDARFGKDKEGSKEVIQTLALQMHFQIEYLGPLVFEGFPISSSRIRTLIQQGDFVQASVLLGRKYSIISSVIKQELNQITLDHTGLCLPTKERSYPVSLISQGITYDGTTTIGESSHLIIKLNSQDFPEVYGHKVEVVF